MKPRQIVRLKPGQLIADSMDIDWLHSVFLGTCMCKPTEKPRPAAEKHVMFVPSFDNTTYDQDLSIIDLALWSSR